jgi:SAM-dependent methyltransferase
LFKKVEAFCCLIMSVSADMKEGKPTETGNFAKVQSRELDSSDLKFVKEWINDQLTEEELKQHILAIHNVICNSIHVFGCISAFLYLSPCSFLHSYRPKMIEDALSNPSYKVLDLGCCFGQETRDCILAGVNPNQMYVTDLVSTYWEAGKKMFLDNSVAANRRTNEIESRFGDFALSLSERNSLPEGDIALGWENKFDAVMCWAVFHTLTKEQSGNMIKRIAIVLKKGGVLLGSCGGTKVAGISEFMLTPSGAGQRFLHDSNTLTNAMKEAGFTGEMEIIEVSELGKLLRLPPWMIQNMNNDPNKAFYFFKAVK